MTYTIIAVVVSILALVLLFIAARLLSNKKWIPGFLRGCLGIILVMLTIVLGLSAKDIASYKAAENAQTIATLSFRNKEANTYQVEIQETSGVFYTNEIHLYYLLLSLAVLAVLFLLNKFKVSSFKISEGALLNYRLIKSCQSANQKY